MKFVSFLSVGVTTTVPYPHLPLCCVASKACSACRAGAPSRTVNMQRAWGPGYAQTHRRRWWWPSEKYRSCNIYHNWYYHQISPKMVTNCRMHDSAVTLCSALIQVQCMSAALYIIWLLIYLCVATTILHPTLLGAAWKPKPTAFAARTLSPAAIGLWSCVCHHALWMRLIYKMQQSQW